uniref:F-box domain-containing protein n=1 Tax=Leptobrachium leishanense TaxID=445787 RepID=A0A8C5M2R2_9ANUR
MEKLIPNTGAPSHEIGQVDTPRTSNLKFLREKRLSYFSQEQSKSSMPGLQGTPRSRGNVGSDIQQPKRSNSPRICRSAPPFRLQQTTSIPNGGPKLIDNEVAKTVSHIPKISPLPQDQTEVSKSEPSTHRSILTSSFISGLDQELLEDSSVPEADKLQHVMTWAQKFLSKWNSGGRLQNSSFVSQDANGMDIPPIKTDDEEPESPAYASTNPTNKILFNALSSSAAFSSPLYDHCTTDLTLVEINNPSAVKRSTKFESDMVHIKKQPYFHDSDEELLPHNRRTTKMTHEEKACFSSNWTDIGNKKKVGASLNVTTQCAFTQDKNNSIKSFRQVSPPTLKSGLNSKNSRNDIYLVKQVDDGRMQDHDKEDILDFSKYEQSDYDSDSTLTVPVGHVKDNQEDEQSSSESSLNTERLNDFLAEFEKRQKDTERSYQSMDNDGSRTDRTYFVKRYTEPDTTRQYGSLTEQSRLGRITGIEKHSYPALSSNNLLEDSKPKFQKVCPVCSFTNGTSTSCCIECGSILFAVQRQHKEGATEKKSVVAMGMLVDELFVCNEIENPQRISEQKPPSKLNVNECNRTHCWEQSSDVTSDCGGSVLEKYLYYVNNLEKLKIKEQRKSSEYNMPSTNSSEESSEDESSLCYNNPNIQSTVIQHQTVHLVDSSDSEESETQFLGATNALLRPGSAYAEKQTTGKRQDLSKNNVMDFNGTNIKSSIDSKLPKSTHIPSRVTGPKRYWEKSSIAWSSYTHGELKPRSSCVQRPVSAETTKSMSCKEDQNKKISYHAATNHNTRPSKASAADVGKYKSSAVAFMKTTNAWAVSEHLSKRKWDGFSETLILDHESLWLHLPDELWISIFSNLSHKDLANVAQVCQRFQYVANDDSLWNVIEITNCHSLNDDSLTNIGCHHPKSLTLYRCHDDIQCITNSGLESLFQNCKDSLTNLKMTNCSGSKFDGDTILLHASQHCRQLTNLDISWNGATDKGVIALVESSACLKSLSVNGCKITDRAIDALVKKHSKSLIKLEVFGCHALTARCLCLVATECTHLQTLNIGRVPKVTDMCLVKIASNLHKMTTLNVTGLNVVRDRTVHHIVKQCSKLENLTLSSCCQVTDVSLVEISTYLQTIKYLDLSGCKKVTDIGIQALARSCRQISYLDLSSTGTGKRGVPEVQRICRRKPVGRHCQPA